jgi:hypothetical protein
MERLFSNKKKTSGSQRPMDDELEIEESSYSEGEFHEESYDDKESDTNKSEVRRML